MDPPYNDSSDMYGKNEIITANTNWSIMYLLESCKKQRKEVPTIMISNCEMYFHRLCKYKSYIVIKHKSNIHHKPRIESISSNKSMGLDKRVIIG
jgi:hypothetical protein